MKVESIKMLNLILLWTTPGAICMTTETSMLAKGCHTFCIKISKIAVCLKFVNFSMFCGDQPPTFLGASSNFLSLGFECTFYSPVSAIIRAIIRIIVSRIFQPTKLSFKERFHFHFHVTLSTTFQSARVIIFISWESDSIQLLFFYPVVDDVLLSNNYLGSSWNQ